jgi:hypothetical protein
MRGWGTHAAHVNLQFGFGIRYRRHFTDDYSGRVMKYVGESSYLLTDESLLRLLHDLLTTEDRYCRQHILFFNIYIYDISTQYAQQKGYVS